MTSAGRPSRKWTTERTPSSAGSSLPLRSARATRSAFLIDARGTIRGAWHYQATEVPDFDVLLAAARAL